jgi:hypothetical protein
LYSVVLIELASVFGDPVLLEPVCRLVIVSQWQNYGSIFLSHYSPTVPNVRNESF